MPFQAGQVRGLPRQAGAGAADRACQARKGTVLFLPPGIRDDSRRWKPIFRSRKACALSCHNPHVSSEKALLKTRMAYTCFACHSKVEDATVAKHATKCSKPT